MGNLLLITRPRYDITTHYLFSWSKILIDAVRKKGKQVIDLQADRANKKEFESIVIKKQPFLVMFNGHGGNDLITGQDGEILVKADDNEKLLKHKVVYARSCATGKVLGPKSIASGTRTYIGYNEDFIFFSSNDKISKPLEDKRAALFLEPSNQIIISLLKGHSAVRAHQQSKSLFLKNIQKVLTSESSEVYLARYLLWDMNHQVCLGDETAQI